MTLRYCGKSDTIFLIEQIQQLSAENKLLKTQVVLVEAFNKNLICFFNLFLKLESETNHHDSQQE